jgi:hypothetical protein
LFVGFEDSRPPGSVQEKSSRHRADGIQAGYEAAVEALGEPGRRPGEKTPTARAAAAR